MLKKTAIFCFIDALGPDLLATGPGANWPKEYFLWLEASGLAKM